MKRLRFILSIAIASLAARAGFAQTIFHHPISPTEVAGFKEKLHLDEAQAESMDLLYESNAANFKVESAAFRELRARFNKAFEKDIPDEDRDPADIQLRIDFGNTLEKLRVTRTELARTTMRDFELLLTEKQKEEYWPGVLRDHRRRLLGLTDTRGAACWGNMNLVKLTESLEIDPQDRAAITPIMEQYALDMDKILQNFESVLWKYPTQRSDEYRKASLNAGRQADALNRKYCQFMAGTLSPAVREKFLDAAYSEAYFQIYGLINEDAALMPRIMELPDLTAEQIQALATLNTKWNSDLQDFYRRGRETQDRASQATQIMPEDEYFERLQDPSDALIRPFENGISESFTAIVKPYGENLRKILTPAQQEILWPPPKVELDPKTIETAKQRQR